MITSEQLQKIQDKYESGATWLEVICSVPEMITEIKILTTSLKRAQAACRLLEERLQKAEARAQKCIR